MKNIIERLKIMTVHRTQSEIRLAIHNLWEEYEEYKKVHNSFKEGSSANKHMRWIYSKIQHEEEMLDRRILEDQERERGERK